jgi:hypothetical protein
MEVVARPKLIESLREAMPEIRGNMGVGMRSSEVTAMMAKYEISTLNNVSGFLASVSEELKTVPWELGYALEVLIGRNNVVGWGRLVNSDTKLRNGYMEPLYSTGEYGGLFRTLFEIEDRYPENVPKQAEILGHVCRLRRFSASEVAASMTYYVDPGVVSFYLGKLVEKGLVERKGATYKTQPKLREEYSKAHKSWESLKKSGYVN